MRRPNRHRRYRGRQSRLIPFALVLLLASFIPDDVRANDSILRDNGYTVHPIGTEAVHMLSEHITVAIGEREPVAEVQCDFVFENTTGETVTALVGFPTRTYDPSIESTREPFLYFESKIDGRPIPVRLRKEILTHAHAVSDDSYSEEEDPLRYWYTWDVEFPPHTRLRLHNRYSTSLSEDSVSGQWFEYILTTGSNWKGSIGRVVIEVSYESKRELRQRVVGASPGGFEIRGNTIRWEFHDHTPRENVRVDERRDKYREFDDALIPLMEGRPYEGGTRLYTIDDMRIADKTFWADLRRRAAAHVDQFYRLEHLVDHINRLYARLLRNEIFARHGRTFASRDMRFFFDPSKEKYPDQLGVAWYRPNPEYSDTLLNETERKNIRFMLDYEGSQGWR